MQAPQEDTLSAVSNFGFILCSVTVLFFLAGNSNDGEIENYDDEPDSDNEERISVETLTIENVNNKNLEIYTMLLKDLHEAPKIEVERMLSFNEMLNPRRRSYSADDLDALDLITDKRLQAVYNRALSDISLNTNATDEYIDSDGRSSRTSNFSSTSSWDHLT